MRNSQRKTSIPFWCQILLILFLGIFASAIVFAVVSNYSRRIEEENLPMHTVTFAYPDGTIIDEKIVREGKGVFPPSLEIDGVFRGWSASFNYVQSDIEVHPVYYNIVEENLFYFDSVYVKEGEKFTIDIYVDGKVNASSGNIVLNYDAEVLKYKKADVPDFVDVVKGKVGELTISFNCDSPLNEKTRITELTFYAKKKDAYSTQVSLSAKDVVFLDNDEIQPATFATINNKIFFLQEVEE